MGDLKPIYLKLDETTRESRNASLVLTKHASGEKIYVAHVILVCHVSNEDLYEWPETVREAPEVKVERSVVQILFLSK